MDKKKLKKSPVPRGLRELSQDLDDMTDQLMDANQFIDEHDLTEEWEEYKSKKYEERILRKVKKDG